MLLLLTSIAAFVSTNVDDIFILMLFYGNKNYRPAQVVAGQYIGFIALVIVSVVGSFAGTLIDNKYIGLLGLVPIYLGIRDLVKTVRSDEEQEAAEDISSSKHAYGPVLSMALITFANGGDNIGIYIPLFVPLSWAERFWVVTIFLLMLAWWCSIARYLSSHPIAAKAINRYGHIAGPIILILLGVFILVENGSFELIR